ncbi:hypothetical protein TRFO_15536 [Tritrichomonas foetus]|uniref:Uncharacterized protein n=1 Tax=Tritrichomonas foetus TaxID=1144522 RepID=A0A1J4KX01_9EUKA|nr:hypothetical protein TRFO_15536 [Tritrichomonas foetus]|eukprot:OHT14230.1 hypothetical protein TRFO_15536 [Tritrichomonas foetus]
MFGFLPFLFIFSLSKRNLRTKRHHRAISRHHTTMDHFQSNHNPNNFHSISKHRIYKTLKDHDDDDDDYYDDDDDDDDDDDFFEKFVDFAKTTNGIITLSCAGVALIIIVALIVFCCRKCAPCAKCCKCCGRNSQPINEQYGQVILDNNDEIDYGLESI